MFGSSGIVAAPRFCEHLRTLSDDTGLLQHAHFHLPDRHHGYCTDDNARALILMMRLSRLRPLSHSEAAMRGNYAAFVGHAYDEDTGTFRNFMNYARTWCDTKYFEDPHGRAVWALGEVMAAADGTPLATWARNLFDRLARRLASINAPRAWAFALFGLEAALKADPDWDAALQARRALAGKLAERWSFAAKADWPWFEDVLAYDNARLAEAAVAAGDAEGDEPLRQAGLEALEALWRWQEVDGVFHPVGHESFGRLHAAPKRFDQQPLEAAAMLDACLRAYEVTGEERWRTRAGKAFGWFHGDNALGLPLAEPERGLCHDGLQPDRINANAGAESTVSYLWACVAAAGAGAAGDEGQP